jgi:L-iditol 2-dehydrogenase
LCDESIFMGGFQVPGLLRQYAVVPARNVSVVSDTMSFTDTVVVEPLAVLLHTLELVKLTPGDAVAIMGAGPIGLLAAAVTKQSGAACVTVADRIPERLELAKKFGADVVVDFTKDSVSDAVYDATNGNGAHIVIDAAGSAESVGNAIASARSGAHVVVVGIPSQREVEVPFWQAMDKELTFYIQKRSNNNDHEAISMITQGLIDISPLVTHRFSLEQGDRAFQMVHDYSDGVCKAVIEL